MKEIIVIEKTKECRPHPALREGVNCIDTKYCQYEQVTETWEELKTMCREKNINICENRIEIKMNNDDYLYFHKNGHIYCMNEDSNISIGYDRTPQQMWQIIKSLIGEE